MIISLHLPKTAGMSFGKSLSEFYGDNILFDYEDTPMAKSKYDRAYEALSAGIKISKKGLGNYECVHGHFLPAKYLLLSEKIEIKFITWMRDPVERMLSHYYYWKRSYDPKRAVSHHKKFIEEDWSLERFCLGSEFQNIYKQYFWGFPEENFDFVGIVEYYQEDLTYFSHKYFAKNIPLFQVNTAGDLGDRYMINAEFRKKIELHHKDDMEIYRKFLKAREFRI